MAVSTAAPSHPARRRVAFERLRGFPALFARYAAGDPGALQFFEYDWGETAALRRAAERTTALERDRKTLVEVLREQNRAWGNHDPPVMENIAALEAVDTVSVVTGQQLGLFGGPLYTLYKAVTAVQLASRAQEQLGRPVVPVFWLADEDHDWEEVRSAVIIRGDEPHDVSLPPGGGTTPVGRRTLGEELDPLLQELEEACPRTESTGELLVSLRAAWRPESTVREAFARWMGRLFTGTGLVLISGDERRLKRLAAPLLRREIEDPAGSLAALLDQSRRLETEGFHQQVTPLPGQLFLIGPDGRRALDPSADGSFSIRATRRTARAEELLETLATEPERLSPNVVLRPVVEDLLLPTLAYVAGPGEVSYYAQLRGVYEHFGVPMPLVYPRASVTLVEPRVRRVLDRYALAPEELMDGSPEVIDALHAKLALERSAPPIEDSFESARNLLHRAADAVRPAAEETDASLGRSVESLRQRLMHDLEIIERKVVRAQKRRHEQIGRHLRRAAAHLFPHSRPQERVLSPIHLLNRYGLGLAATLIERLELDTSEHQVVEL